MSATLERVPMPDGSVREFLRLPDGTYAPVAAEVGGAAPAVAATVSGGASFPGMLGALHRATGRGVFPAAHHVDEWTASGIFPVDGPGSGDGRVGYIARLASDVGEVWGKLLVPEAAAVAGGLVVTIHATGGGVELRRVAAPKTRGDK